MADETTTSEATTAASTEATAAATTGTETTQATETAATTTAVAPPAWSDLLKAIADEDARKFAERYTDLGALAKGGLELRKLSSQRDGWVKLPGANATDEEKTAWRKAVGLPEAPEGYGVALPEEMTQGDAEAGERFGRLLKVAHETGVPGGAMKAIVDWYISENRTIATREAEALKAARDQGEQALRQQWGSDYEANLGYAARTVEHFGGPEVHQKLAAAGLMVDPDVVRAFAKIGRMTAESVPAIAQPRQQVISDYEAIKAEAGDRWGTPKWNDADFQRRWAEANARKASLAA